VHGRLAALKRHHPEDRDRIRELEAELKAAILAAHIQRVVDSAPALSQEQIDRLAVLLRGAA
jgi:hypothetical protein